MIPAEGTFEYVAVVPASAGPEFSCVVKSRPVPGDVKARLVGFNPQLHITDAGPTINPSPSNPATQRSQIRFIASDRSEATVREVAFIVDRGVISSLRAGDLIHFARTGCGRIGVSALRDDQLIFAVGAITSVPLGRDFQVSMPYDLVRQAVDVFKLRDPRFNFQEYPLEFRADGESHIRYQGRMSIGDFEIWMKHGHYNGMPGTDACVSVARRNACPSVDANISAMFLDMDTLAMVRW